MKKKHLLLLLCFFSFCIINAEGQTHTIKGIVYDEQGKETLPGATVIITSLKDSVKFGINTDDKGKFETAPLAAGKYKLQISFIGFEHYKTTVQIAAANIDLGKVQLKATPNALNEVKIVEKIIAVTQKDDTTEYNAAAYKINPDADASDLVKKMPGVELNMGSKEVKAQGEKVVKIMVDGKPFFGNDPYATLSNLPADIIDKVQVYNEKSEQEQFTGFNEGQTSKTINIITKKDKRNGIFGKMSVAGGTDEDNNNKYAIGGNMHEFNGDKRLSVTLQTNNMNTQNFGEDDVGVGAKPNGAGISKIYAGGINYSDKWGKKTDINASYFFNEATNTTSQDMQRQYILPGDSQIYNENSNNSNSNYSHRVNLRINSNIDSQNSILIQPQLSLQRNYNNNVRIANSTLADTLQNSTNNNTVSNMLGYNFSTNVLLRHKFHKKGRTFSIAATVANNHNDGNSILNAQNIFYTNKLLDDTLNQLTKSLQNAWTFNSNITYTEPIGKKGMLQVQYNFNDAPGNNERNVYEYANSTGAYTIPEDSLSNKISSKNTQHKAGTSYQYQEKYYSFSFGLYYQYSTLYNTQELPYVKNIDHNYDNLLPVASFQYRITPQKNIHVNYSTSTSLPSVTQLQDVINNSNPLQLSTGNPSLKQPYKHDLSIRYTSTSTTKYTTLSVMLSGNVTQDYITNSTIIAEHDTTLRQNIILPQGSQLTMPVNINGLWNVRTNISYGLPVTSMKCNINFNINGSISHTPGIINNATNYDDKKTAGLGITVSSNISEGIDFLFSSNTNINNDVNTLNPTLNTNYVNESTGLNFTWLTKSGFVFNTDVTYQYYSGLAVGFNQNYALWNMSFGKKMFKKHAGDLRLTAYDILNQNTSLQHTVTESYISDVRSTVLKRYFVLTFTYKIRSFK